MQSDILNCAYLHFSSNAASLGAGHSSTAGQDFLFKMLCPNSVVGSIIGIAGAVINQLNQTTGARIKVSQNKEFFPETTDRVIAISGSVDTISVAIMELVTKIIEVCRKSFLTPCSHDSNIVTHVLDVLHPFLSHSNAPFSLVSLLLITHMYPKHEFPPSSITYGP